MSSEAQIEKAVCDYARKRGAIVMKLSGMNQKGQPDRMFLHDGRVVFVEFKKPGNEPTRLQWKWLKELQAQGFTAFWTDNVKIGKDMLAMGLFGDEWEP